MNTKEYILKATTCVETGTTLRIGQRRISWKNETNDPDPFKRRSYISTLMFFVTGEY